MKRWLFNAVKLYAKPHAKRFRAALNNPEESQQEVLQSIVDDLKLTLYGKHYDVRCIQSFKRNIPLVSYDDLEPWIKKQQRCEMNVLVNGEVLFYEKTSGSTGPSKYIPYTKKLRSSFSRMFILWAYDIITGIPQMGSGKLYFSISPSFDEEELTDGGVPVGLEDDADYLGPYLKSFLSPFLLIPEGVSSIKGPDDYRQALCAALLIEENLESISIWNPSFLRVLMDWIQENKKQLLIDCQGKISSARLDSLSATPIDWKGLWPNLKFISTWADAHAKSGAKRLQDEFVGVTVQGKGLLATEAPVSIPMLGVDGCVPLVTEVYFEFISEAGELKEIAELEVGKTYEIIVTQRGGLVRYRLGDYVRVVGKALNTPTFEFIGRGNAISDLVGEKLHEDFVRNALDAIFSEPVGFCALLPIKEPRDGYILVVDEERLCTAERAKELEERLCQAFHYGHARSLGQLAPVQITCEPRIESLLCDFYIRMGKRWGDVKSSCLLTMPIDSELYAELRRGSLGVSPYV